MADEFVLKDSGQRRDFDTGSRRDVDTGKPRYDLLSTWANKRTAEHLAKGAAKYGDRNWEKGQPVSTLLSSALRHLNQFIQGDRVEDHLAAVRFGVDAIMHFEELAKQGDETALRMLDAYASAKLAADLRGEKPFWEQELDSSGADYEPPTEIEYTPVTAEEVQQAFDLFQQQADTPPEAHADFSWGDEVLHKNGRLGMVTASFSNGDVKVRWQGDVDAQFYPAGLTKNFTKV